MSYLQTYTSLLFSVSRQHLSSKVKAALLIVTSLMILMMSLRGPSMGRRWSPIAVSRLSTMAASIRWPLEMPCWLTLETLSSQLKTWAVGLCSLLKVNTCQINDRHFICVCVCKDTVYYFEICLWVDAFMQQQQKKAWMWVNAFFLLTEKPVHIFRDLLNVKAVPGEDAELSCEISNPDAIIHWLKNGHLIRQSPKYEMSVEKNLARLVIKNSTIRDSGEYCCEAEGAASRAKLEIRGRWRLFKTNVRWWLCTAQCSALYCGGMKINAALNCSSKCGAWLSFLNFIIPFRTPAHICKGVKGRTSRWKR